MRVSQVLKDLLKRSLDDRCPQIAASLAYATLLALIPLTVLIYKIFNTAFVNPDWQFKVQEFVFESLTPTTAEQVRQYLYDNAVHASSLNIIGLLTLLSSVIIMMFTIDTALNSIWKIKKPRFLLRRFIVYISILVFGPLAIAYSLFVSTYVASLPVITQFMGTTFDDRIISRLPFIVTWIAFTMLYKWVPDCKIRWRHAFTGGTIAACLFEVAKGGFSLYVSYFSTYQLFYGALSSIPLLLIWIYLTWLTVLIGAEIAHYMGN